MEDIRLSIGTAIALGLRKGVLPHPPTTMYMMVGDACKNNCAFCTQARDADGGDLLSRVTWPRYPLAEVLQAISDHGVGSFGRICLQSLMDPAYISSTLPEVVEKVHSASGLPISLSISPVSSELLAGMRGRGVERVGIALDAASPEIFHAIKGKGVGNPYTYKSHWKSLEAALEVFGKGKVSTHVIVGLGESDMDIVRVMSRCASSGILLSLFAYTPMKGTKEIGQPPDIGRYRSLQICRYAILERGFDIDAFGFDGNGKLASIPEQLLDQEGAPAHIFQTVGCPDCNRPYYNERPGGVIYNYPHALDLEMHTNCLSEARGYLYPDMC